MKPLPGKLYWGMFSLTFKTDLQTYTLSGDEGDWVITRRVPEGRSSVVETYEYFWGALAAVDAALYDMDIKDPETRIRLDAIHDLIASEVREALG